MIEKMFENATRTKMRFPYKGEVSVEELWELSVENLDSIFKSLNSKAKQSKEESLLNTKSKEDEVLAEQIEIIKYIVNVKQNEVNEKILEKAKKDKIRKLHAALAETEDAELKGKSPAEIRAMLAELE